MTVPTGRALIELVAGLDPEAGRPKAVIDRRALADLTAILASETDARPVLAPRAPAVRRRRYIAVPVAAALAAVLLVLWPGGGPGGGSTGGGGTAFAATPAALSYLALPAGTDPRALLRQIATRTAALPDDTGSGRYAHLVTRGWNLFTSVDGQRVTSAVVPQLRESWISPDGAGRTVTTTERPGRSPHLEDQRYQAGGLSGNPDLRDLSADDRVLAQQLERDHPVENGPAERLVAINDTYGQVPVPPKVRAALLRYLAATPTLTATGTVTDRVGRAGVAFSVDSDYSGLPTRYTLIIDPDTGELLASEDTLTSRAGALNVAIPSVISYTVHLAANYIDRTD